MISKSVDYSYNVQNSWITITISNFFSIIEKHLLGIDKHITVEI